MQDSTCRNIHMHNSTHVELFMPVELRTTCRITHMNNSTCRIMHMNNSTRRILHMHISTRVELCICRIIHTTKSFVGTEAIYVSYKDYMIGNWRRLQWF